MKAKDVEVGREYVASRSNNWRAYAYDAKRVRVLAAPIEGETWNGWQGKMVGTGKTDSARVVILESDTYHRGYAEVGKEQVVPLRQLREPWEDYYAEALQRRRIAAEQREAREREEARYAEVAPKIEAALSAAGAEPYVEHVRRESISVTLDFDEWERVIAALTNEGRKAPEEA
jgi:hypothetical protein